MRPEDGLLEELDASRSSSNISIVSTRNTKTTAYIIWENASVSKFSSLKALVIRSGQGNSEVI